MLNRVGKNDQLVSDAFFNVLPTVFKEQKVFN